MESVASSYLQRRIMYKSLVSIKAYSQRGKTTNGNSLSPFGNALLNVLSTSFRLTSSIKSSGGTLLGRPPFLLLRFGG
jgi:hypothetical protein